MHDRARANEIPRDQVGATECVCVAHGDGAEVEGRGSAAAQAIRSPFHGLKPRARGRDARAAVVLGQHPLADEARALSGGRHKILLKVPGAGCLLGSRRELQSAFGNLSSNAVRYTADGGSIELWWEQSKDGDAWFRVKDSGIGVEAQHLPRLTERFYRVDRGRSRESGGTGLGLAIVKHVLTRHQATLEIESRYGHGSCFSIHFPAKRCLPGRR